MARAGSEIGYVTGLTAEADLARPLSSLVAAGGGDYAGAAFAAERLVQNGACALISFGLAGGLDPALLPGTLVVPARIIGETPEFEADFNLLARFGGATVDAMFAGHEIVATAAEKAALFAQTGAAAVDLESGAVARVAARHRLPFLALRVVCDPATSDLPPAALVALNAAGAIGAWRVAQSVLLAPWQVPALLQLARDAKAARATLAQLVAQHASPRRPYGGGGGLT